MNSLVRKFTRPLTSRCFSHVSLVRRKFLDFECTAVMNDLTTRPFQLSKALSPTNHCVLLFYPFDFTFVCPSELAAFSHLAKRKIDVFGISCDSVYAHQKWLSSEPKDGGIKNLVTFPLLSDPQGKIAELYGVKLQDPSCSLRAHFVIDNQGLIRHAATYDLQLGRSVHEVQRVCQMIEFVQQNNDAAVCPANWTQGNKGLHPNAAATAAYLTSLTPPL